MDVNKGEKTYMPILLLNDFVLGNKIYMLDTEDGTFTEKLLPISKEGLMKNTGFAIYKTVGIFFRKKLFIALYADQKKMQMCIGTKVFDFDDPNLHVKRNVIAPFVKKFSVYRGKDVVLYFYYFYCEIIYGKFPDYNSRDMMDFIEYVTHSPANIRKYTCLWTEMSQGKDPRSLEFQNELKLLEKEDD